MKLEADTIVIGGGLLGCSIAYGLARAGDRVVLLDEGDDAFRAARGNFGLVWVQGKGAGETDGVGHRAWPEYARWTLASARAWPALAAELHERGGVDVELAQHGGLTLALDEHELAARERTLSALRRQLDAHYPFETLDAAAVRRLVPQIGKQVVGALWCPLDGQVSPLKLLRALVQSFRSLGGEHGAGRRIDRIVPCSGGGFEVHAAAGVHAAPRLVLAAGLGNAALAPQVGLSAPVRPNRGQILVTERLQPFLRHPTMQLRQTAEGVVQIGDSKEDVGLDDGTTLAELARIADRALRCFPLLAGVNIVRTWGALRVMTDDGYPIYQASRECPGAFVVTCHSGITLAAQHAGPLVDWLRGGLEPVEIRGFKVERFAAMAGRARPDARVHGDVAAS